MLRFEDVLVASNAAIGGPATAAVQDSNRWHDSSGYSMGYATGTWIGVTVTKFLQRLI